MTSYNLFCSSLELIFCLKLVDNFPILPFNPREKQTIDKNFENIKSRVFLFFTHWVKIYSTNYEKNKIIQNLIRNKISQDDSTYLDLNTLTMHEPILPMKLLTFNKLLKEGIFFCDPTELAKQISLIDHKLFSNISMIDFNNFIRKKEMPESFSQILIREKQIKCYIFSFILSQNSLEDKKNALQNFILLANACRSLNNFQTSYTILSCLMKVQSTKKNYLFIEKKYKELFSSMEKDFIDIELQDFQYKEEYKKIMLPVIPNIQNLIYKIHNFITISKDNEISSQLTLAKNYKEFFLEITDILRKKYPFFRVSPIYEFLEYGIIEYLRPKTWNLKFKGDLNFLEDYKDYDKILEFIYEKFKN